jgi:hypothetical protein
MSNVVLGIDIGVAGAVALLGADGSLLAVDGMPVLRDATGELGDWLRDRKNRRTIPYRLEQCGYVPIRNDAAKSGLWVIGDTRQVIYAKSELAIRDRLRAAKALLQ